MRLVRVRVWAIVILVAAAAGALPALRAWWRWRESDPVVARGRERMVKFRCESCHGIGGSGGVANPGSFKGYVPGWLGDDFKDLARDDSELRQWILDGGVERLAKDHLAVFFLTRQRL